MLLSLVLVACGPREVSVANDPAVFRGTWVSTAEKSPGSTLLALRLELVATWTSATEYAVSGTLQLADDTVLPVNGRVYGSGYERYVLVPPPLSLELKGRGADGSEVLWLYCIWGPYLERRDCNLRISSGARSGDYQVLNLRKP